MKLKKVSAYRTSDGRLWDNCDRVAAELHEAKGVARQKMVRLVNNHYFHNMLDSDIIDMLMEDAEAFLEALALMVETE